MIGLLLKVVDDVITEFLSDPAINASRGIRLCHCNDVGRVAFAGDSDGARAGRLPRGHGEGQRTVGVIRSSRYPGASRWRTADRTARDRHQSYVVGVLVSADSTAHRVDA